MALEQKDPDYGCLFCRSGSEERLIGELQNSHPTLRCISPKRVRIRRHGEKDLDTLIPGYIFFNTTDPVDFRAIIDKNDVYRLLKYPTGSWQLCGTDLQIAQMMFEMGGIIGLSKGAFEGNSVRILDGPLKVYEKHITKWVNAKPCGILETRVGCCSAAHLLLMKARYLLHRRVVRIYRRFDETFKLGYIL